LEESTLLDPRFKNYFAEDEVNNRNSFHRLTVIAADVGHGSLRVKTEPKETLYTPPALVVMTS
jgi:hypothetical protein